MTPFEHFWAAWPSVNGKRHHRAGNRKGCERRWNAMKLDALSGDVMRSLEAYKLSADWAKEGGQYIPAPECWLNKTPWEAGDPPAAVDKEKAARVARIAANLRKQVG